MKQFKQYSIPESWNEITIKQQLEVERLSETNPEFKPLAVVAGYCSIPFEDVKKMPINEIKEVLNSLTFISTPLPSEPVSEFEYKGENYSVIPTLLRSEAQDFLTLTSVEGRKDALLYVVAVLAKKSVNGKYESLSDFNIDERAKHFQDLPLTIGSRIHFFFAMTGALLSIDSTQVLKEYDQNIKESINSILNTPKNSDGGGPFTRFLRVILLSYLRFLKRNWNKYYSGYNSKTEKPNWTIRFKKYCRKKLKRN